MEQMQLGIELPELDRRKTQEAVEAALEKYRIFKMTAFEEREASTTASYSSIPRGNTNVTSDQTGDIATHNVDIPAMRKAYCEKIERAVNKLPRMEKFLMTERYLSIESEYITDFHVYTQCFNPPISEGTYYKIRWKAFYRFVFNLMDARIINPKDVLK